MSEHRNLKFELIPTKLRQYGSMITELLRDIDKCIALLNG